MMRTMEASITAHSRTVGDAMRTVLSTAVSNINRMKPEFETAGKNAGQGFINGINSKLGGARSASRSLGLAALEAAKKALDSHSPPGNSSIWAKTWARVWPSASTTASSLPHRPPPA